MRDESPKLIQPQNHRAKVSIWGDLTVVDMDRITEAATADQLKSELADIFHLSDFKENMKTGVLIDLYFYTIQFARDKSFTKEQTSAFFSIVKKTHEVCIETPFGNVEQCFNYFREMVLCHAVKRPPFSVDLFTAEEVRSITDYVINTYFRHYKMYKYAFTPLVRLDLTMNYVGMPPTPEPSEHGDAEEATEGEKGKTEETDEKLDGETEVSAEGREQPPAPQETTVKDEEPAAAKELRMLIKEHLSEELKKLKISMDEQLKTSEEVLNKKLASIEGSSSAKGGRGSAKAKKK